MFLADLKPLGWIVLIVITSLVTIFGYSAALADLNARNDAKNMLGLFIMLGLWIYYMAIGFLFYQYVKHKQRWG